MAQWSPKEAWQAAWRAYCINHPRLSAPIEDRLRAAGVARCRVPTPCGNLSLLKQTSNVRNDAQPVVLIHGSPAGAARWQDYLLDQSTPENCYVSVDRPGFGQSVGLGGMPDLHQQAMVTGEALWRSGHLEGAILVGHSLGGAVATALALAYPDWVKGLVLVCAALDPAQEKVSPLQHTLAHPWVRGFIPPVWRHSNEELLVLKQHLLRLQQHLPTLGCPVSVVHSHDDGLVPFANVDYVRRHIPESKLVSIIDSPDGGHFLPWTHRALVERGVATVQAAMQRRATAKKQPEYA